MSRSKADYLLSTANAVDIILYIDEHPGCKKTDIYRSITRNAHTPALIDRLSDSGIVEMLTAGNRSLMWLTPKGERIATALRQIDEILSSEN